MAARAGGPGLGGAIESDIQQAAHAAVEEFEKVLSIRKSTGAETQRVLAKADELTGRIKRTSAHGCERLCALLAELRTVRGEVISLKELRYVERPAIEKAATDLEQNTKEVAGQTVDFLLQPDALKPYAVRVQAIADGIEQVQKVTEANEREKEANAVSAELELLIEVVSNLPIEDPTQTTRIIDNISTIYAGFNQIRAALKRRRQALAGTEAQAEFTAQIKLLGAGVGQLPRPVRHARQVRRVQHQVHGAAGRVGRQISGV